jgi:hypothetical protein
MGLLLLLAMTTLATGLTTVNRTDYANGWDGYYYLVQIKSLHTTGNMHSREYSLVYLPLLAMHALAGDYLIAAKLSAVLIKTIFIMSVFALSFSLSGERHGGDRRTAFLTALIAASISAMSPSLNYFFTQFPKNLLGFALFFFFAATLGGNDRLEGRTTSIRWAWAALLFAGAFFTHRFSAVISLVYLALCCAPQLLARVKHHAGAGAVDRPGAPRWLRLAPAALILATLLVSQRLPLSLSSHDLELITGELSYRPIVVPIHFMRCFGVFRTTLPWRMEVIAGSALPIVTGMLMLFGRTFRKKCLGRRYVILLLLSLMGPFPFLEFNPMSLSYRLFFGTMLMLPIVALPYIRLAVGVVSRPGAGSSPIRRAIPLMVFVAFLGVSPLTGNSYDPELHDPPYAFYEHVSQLCAEALEGRDFELVIAHKALAEMITYNHGFDALPWSPEESFPRERVWRITAGILRDEVAMYLSPEIADRYFIRIAGDYALLREDHWESFLESIAHEPVMVEAVYTWRNPTQLRPGYLMKGRP